MIYNDFTKKFKDVWCEDCGKQGHKSWDCPYKIDTTNLVKIKCEICGEISHPTFDCPMKRRKLVDDLKTNEEELEEFLQMIKDGWDPAKMIKGNEELKMIQDVMDRPKIKEADPLFIAVQGKFISFRYRVGAIEKWDFNWCKYRAMTEIWSRSIMKSLRIVRKSISISEIWRMNWRNKS